MALFAATCEASVRTRGAQQLSKVHTHKEEPAAAPAAPLPEQGFEGKPVAHADMDTYIGDWRREYGPKGPPMHPAACHGHICDNAKSTSVLVVTMLIVAQYL